MRIIFAATSSPRIGRKRRKPGSWQISGNSHAPLPAAPAQQEKEPEVSGYVRQAMDYIAAHYADADISIAVIAEHLRVSEGHLSHVFKKQTGMTVTNYLTKTRIDAAMRMLSRDHVKVYEAAAAVGYKDVTYFSATFKKLTGLSPSEVE